MERIAKPLTNKLILLIEADSFLSGYLSDGITDAGAQILGPARTVVEANALIGDRRQVPHAAVVSADIFEANGRVVSDAIECLGIPLLLTVGRAQKLPSRSANYDILTTPFAAYQVVNHLRAVLFPAQADQPMSPLAGPTLRGH
jgi:hypothetical protein